MAEQSGNLHWNRRRISLLEGLNDVDTGLTLVNLGYQTLEPPIGIQGVAAPADGATPASRVQVIVLPPIGGWTGVTVGEPWFNTTDRHVHVNMTSAVEGGSVVNVLFWNPHTINSPGDADTYVQPIE